MKGRGSMKFQSERKDRSSLGLTIYQNGFGLVKETRRIVSPQATDEIHFLDVARTIEADSATVSGIQVLEQNYDFDFADHQQLFSKYIGQVVAVRDPELDEERQMRLLNATGGIAMECLDTGRIFVDPSGDLILPPLPEELYKQPTLSWKITPAELDQDVHVAYLAQGLEWKAVYVVEVRDGKMALTGWAKISNRTGTDFSGAKLKLVAGEANRPSSPLFPMAEFSAQNNMKRDAQFEEHAFSDYHVYRLGEPATLQNGQSKQIRFLSAEGISAKKTYEVERTSRQAAVKVHFANTAENGLGMPLPKGLVKIFGHDTDGEWEFFGEDTVRETSVDEQCSLVIGKAFDIQSDSREMLREQQEGFEYVTYVYELANRKSENIRIDIVHRFHEPNWKMQSSTHDYEVKDAESIEFKVRLGAGKEVAVEFTYQVDRRRGAIY